MKITKTQKAALKNMGACGVQAFRYASREAKTWFALERKGCVRFSHDTGAGATAHITDAGHEASF